MLESYPRDAAINGAVNSLPVGQLVYPLVGTEAQERAEIA